LWALDVLARGFVSEGFVQVHPFELADFVLVERTDSQVADPLAIPCFFPDNCTVRFFNFRHALSEYSETKSIPTVFCQIGGVGKGYTLMHLSATDSTI
jgi:hypothetical protein